MRALVVRARTTGSDAIHCGVHAHPAWSPDSFVAAYRFAAEAHRGQTVPGTDGLPYIMHVSLVTMEVMTALNAEPLAQPELAIQCALLHDVIEDTAVTYDQIAAQFGNAVADGVQALSKDPAVPKAERMRDSVRRIQTQSREVWAVKLADRITNLAQPPAGWTRAKRAYYRDQAGEILAALGPAHTYLADRLKQRIEAYNTHL